MQADITSASQTYRLREQSDSAGIRHGQTVRTDIPNVAIVAAAGEREIRFCDIGPLRVKEILSPGDGDALPRQVSMDPIEFPSVGRYDIKDALISANGALRISADARTAVRPVGRRNARRPISWLASLF